MTEASGSNATPRADAERFQSRLASLLTQSQAVRLERFDDRDGAVIVDHVVPVFADLVRRGRNLLGEIEQACASADAGLDEGAEDLENLCFFVQREWKQALERLDGLTPATQGWSCLVQIERARDRLLRGLTAVERNLAELAGTTSRTAHVDLLRDALRVRRVLTELRRRVADASKAYEGDPEARLRSAGAALARLIEQEEFTHLRAVDRHLARDLHRRIRNALDESGGSPDGDEPEGLWQDVVHFAALLWDVNRRDELVAEDLAAIDEAVGELRDLDAHAAPPRSVRNRLRILFGRNDRLDDLVDAQVDAGRLREHLLVVRDALLQSRAAGKG